MLVFQYLILKLIFSMKSTVLELEIIIPTPDNPSKLPSFLRMQMYFLSNIDISAPLQVLLKYFTYLLDPCFHKRDLNYQSTRYSLISICLPHSTTCNIFVLVSELRAPGF